MLLKISREPSKKKAHHDKYYDYFSQKLLIHNCMRFLHAIVDLLGLTAMQKNIESVQLNEKTLNFS